MTDIVIGLPVAALVALVFGAGWAAVLHDVPPAGPLGFVFRAWAIAIASFSLVWAWTYPFGLSVRWAIPAVVFVSVFGHVVAIVRRSYPRPSDVARSAPGLVIPLVVTVIGMIPAIASWSRLTIGLRVGPDGAGWAISSTAVSYGNTKSMIDHLAILHPGIGSGGHPPVPDASLTNEVVNSFLASADRWAFPGTAGSILHVIGLSHLWSLLSILVALALLTACTGVWASVLAATGSRWAATFGVALLGLSPSVLNNWHEGGMGELWVMPSCLLLVLPIIGMARCKRPWVPVVAGVGVGMVGILPALNDDLFAYGIAFAIAMILSIFVLGRTWWRNWWPVGVGALVGAAAVAPSTSAFSSEVVLTLQQSGHIGWIMPRWPSVAEAFGVGTPYNFDEIGIVPRSSTSELLGGVADVGVIVFLVALVVRRLRRPSVVLLVAVVGACLAIYIETRYITHASNYQYFKAIVTLAPAGALAAGHLLGEATAPIRIGGRHTARGTAWIRTIAIASCIIAGAVLASAISFIVTYRAQGTAVPSSYTSLAGSTTARAAFNRYNVIGLTFPVTFLEPGLLTTAVGAEVNLNWISTGTAVLVSRSDYPLGVLIFEQYCPRYSCLDQVRPNDVAFRGDGVALVRISGTSTGLAKLPPQDWGTWVAKKYQQVGGKPNLDTSSPVPAG